MRVASKARLYKQREAMKAENEKLKAENEVLKAASVFGTGGPTLDHVLEELWKVAQEPDAPHRDRIAALELIIKGSG